MPAGRKYRTKTTAGSKPTTTPKKRAPKGRTGPASGEAKGRVDSGNKHARKLLKQIGH